MQVTCYHGTTLSSAQSIMDGSFQPSIGPEEWLGKGIYFFEASATLAWVYARMAVRRAQQRGEDASPAILSAPVDLDGCLDLCEQHWNTAIADIAEQLRQSGELPHQHGLRLTTANNKHVVIADTDMPPGTFRKNVADCEVMNTLWSYAADEAGMAPRSIRAPFTFGRQLFTNSFFFNQSHVQISVKDPDIIGDLILTT